MYGTYYHVFADNKDFGFEEDQEKQARDKFNALKRSGHQRIRLYKCGWKTKQQAEAKSDVNEMQECLLSHGDYPY